MTYNVFGRTLSLTHPTMVLHLASTDLNLRTVVFIRFCLSRSFWSPVFTALHWRQGGLVRRKLSVCSSVCQTRASWQDEKKLHPDFYNIRKIT